MAFRRNAFRSGEFRPSGRLATILESPMVAAQTFFDPKHGLIGAGVGVVGAAFGVQRDFRVQVHVTLCAKPRTLALHRDMPGISAVEIFAHGLADSRDNALAQRFADIQILARNAKCHGGSPLQAPLKSASAGERCNNPQTLKLPGAAASRGAWPFQTPRERATLHSTWALAGAESMQRRRAGLRDQTAA